MMDSNLKGLFGGGADADAKVGKANDFVKRVSEGAPDQGFSTDEAVGHLNQLLSHASGAQVERATKSALTNMSQDQQQEFGQFVNQLKARKTGGAATTGASSNIDINDISKMFGQAGGSAGSVTDLFGSLGGLLGGGSTTGATTGAASGGILAMIMKFISGLMGGSKASSTVNSGATSGIPDLGGLLGGTTGKVLMGGIAAALIKELADGKN
jgi:hypothetical protein